MCILTHNLFLFSGFKFLQDKPEEAFLYSRAVQPQSSWWPNAPQVAPAGLCTARGHDPSLPQSHTPCICMWMGASNPPPQLHHEHTQVPPQGLASCFTFSSSQAPLRHCDAQVLWAACVLSTVGFALLCYAASSLGAGACSRRQGNEMEPQDPSCCCSQSNSSNGSQVRAWGNAH